MTIIILTLLALLALAFGFGWLARRAWGAKNIFVKWAGSILSGLLMAVVLLISFTAMNGLYKFYTPKYNPAPEFTVAGTPEQIARGEHLAGAFCIGCHSITGDFPMTGGRDLADDLPIDLGSFIASNLTPAGPISGYTDGELFRALRENVDEDGGRLVTMSGTNVRFMSDEDIKAVIAFLRSQEPVENDTPNPPDQGNFLAFVLFGAGAFPESELLTGEIVAPEKAVTAEYGEFIMSFLDCKLCHGADLSGGDDPLGVNGPTLRHLKGWTEEEFITTMRTGITPNKNKMGELMPWEATGRLDDVELGALYQYIISLP
jgi:mono/diheme cytochrome c family protein